MSNLQERITQKIQLGKKKSSPLDQLRGSLPEMTFAGMMNNPLGVGLATAIVSFLILAILRPPMVTKKGKNDFDESFSFASAVFVSLVCGAVVVALNYAF